MVCFGYISSIVAEKLTNKLCVNRIQKIMGDSRLGKGRKARKTSASSADPS